MLLCTYETVNAKGERRFSHWYMGLDGKEYPEFPRGSQTPTWWLSFRAIDGRTREITSRRVGEQTGSTVLLAVSPDGRTLTMTYHRTNTQGQPTQTVAVYDKQ